MTRSFGFTLPHNQDVPSMLSELLLHIVVAFDGPHELALPKTYPGLGNTSARTAGVAMPKATMHENRLASPFEYNIRLSKYARDV